jgi:hypothetical protein
MSDLCQHLYRLLTHCVCLLLLFETAPAAANLRGPSFEGDLTRHGVAGVLQSYAYTLASKG